MAEESVLDEECLALEAIFEDKFTRLQPDKVRLVISAEGADDGSPGTQARAHHQACVAKLVPGVCILPQSVAECMPSLPVQAVYHCI